MRVFIGGSTGAIGRPLVRQLVTAGHEVTGTTRSEARTALIREDGGEPVVVDAFDRDALIEAVAAARPEVVVHEFTQIPGDVNPRKFADEFAMTDRLRTEGTRNLVDAARAAGADRVVAQSIAFAYRQDGAPGDLKTEDEPLIGADEAGDFRRTAESIATLERTVLDGGGLVLRYGYFYGPGTSYAAADGAIAARVRKRRFPIVGSGGGVFSFIHVDDAAAATVAAVERGAPGVYNVVDDDPAPLRDWLPVYAESLGAAPPRRVPTLAARVAAGKWMTLGATQARGASNAKARGELAWEPKYASWRRGFFEAAG
jgi:nucleoside-diphosphate-sugar epimerase